ncbi:MAG: long-chain fatty acid--CoA ligase [Clostridia bacterium]|nr:long-chain fatty acid--CoA ligase [Clostridia bacterium]
MKDKRISFAAEEIKDFRELINRTVNKFPDHIAYKYKIRHGKDDVEYVCKTFSNFKKDVEGLATSLLTMELQGKKVAVISSNRYEWCTTYLAVTTAGMVIVPLDKALPENEIQSLIKRSKIEAIVCEAKYIEAIRNTTDSNLKYIISMDETIEKDVIFYQDLLNQGKKLRENGNREYEAIQIDPEEMSIILFTSGTTNISKGVMLSQKNICSNLQAIAMYAHMLPTDTLLSVLPIHHTFECTITFLIGFYFGSAVAFCEGLKYIQKNMQEFKVSVFVGVPLILENIHKKVWKGIEEQGKTKLIKAMIVITKLLSKIGIDLRRKVFKPILDQFGGKLRIVFVGAAPLDKKIIKGFNEFGVDLVQGYGLTETSPVVSCESEKRKKPGSIGFPLANLEVKIVDPDEQGIGEITVKGPSVMLGYYENEDATNKAMKDGWFSTGDYGYLDKKGYLYISGRKSDIIVLKNGKNIYPQELEFLLNKIPGVVETMVFARNKTSMDTTLCAKIVYDKEQVQEVYGEKNQEELKEVFWQKVKEVNQTLPDVKHIKEIMITEEPLAKTTTQKVKRYEEIKNL